MIIDHFALRDDLLADRKRIGLSCYCDEERAEETKICFIRFKSAPACHRANNDVQTSFLPINVITL